MGRQSFGFLADDLLAWGHDVDLMLRVAPRRTDLLIPYFENLRIRRHPALVSEALRFAETLDRSDPVRSYLLALSSEAIGDAEAAKEHMRLAVRNGYANLVRLTESYAAELADGL
jgi:hypothetical protein